MVDFNYKFYENKIDKIVLRLNNILKNNQELSVIQEKFNKNIKEDKEKNKLEILFMGQYSSGKSSIISALTGKEVLIGQDVTTDKITPYEWDNVLLIDSPGIYAGKDDKHDKLTLEFMNKADLIVYVVTVQGFDATIGKHFLRIAFEEKKVNKMMLIMNKRSMESEENKDGWVTHVKTVLDGKATLDELFFCIIDAKDYLDSYLYDEETKKEIITLSHFEDLKENLNKFIEKNGLLGRLNSELDVITETINSVNDIFVKNELQKNVIDILRKQIRIFTKSKNRFIAKIDKVISKSYYGIVDIGGKLALYIGAKDKEQMEAESNNAEKEINKIIETANDDIKLILTQETEEIRNDIENLESSIYYKDVINEKNIAGSSVDESNYMKHIFSGLNRVSNILKGLSTNTVSSIAKFLGVNFKPWGATKLTNFLTKFGTVFGVVLEIGMFFYAEHKEKEIKEELRKAREDMRNQFNEIAGNLKKGFTDGKNEIISEFYDVQIKQFEDSIKLIESKQENTNEITKKFDLIKKEIDDLRSEMKVNS